MYSVGESGEIIILSDDDDNDDDDRNSENDLSCCLIVEVEDVKKTGNECLILHICFLCKLIML